MKPDHSTRRRTLMAVLAVLALILALAVACSRQAPRRSSFTLVIHGGAGNIARDRLSPQAATHTREVMTRALKAGYGILEKGGSSTDAVVAAINIMEDDPAFNAGKGAVFAADGRNELDAAIMDGNTRKAGAVTGVTHVRNPITLARAVMLHSRHVLLSDDGAEEFARLQGITLVPSAYFFTERRWQQLQQIKDREKAKASTTADAYSVGWAPFDRKFSTVGAVAMDRSGRITAGTSTGGLTNKKFGRVGDSPIIGAGTYADSRVCGVSATGTGEYFIRGVIAHDIAALVDYAGLPLRQAADRVIMKKLVEMGGDGGVIALGADGSVATPFNTTYMARGWVRDDGRVVIKLFHEE